MSLLAIESIGELLALVVSAVGAFAFTTAGTIVEQAALHNVLTGRLVFGAWEAGMGAIALVVGVYVIGYQEFWPRLTNLRRTG